MKNGFFLTLVFALFMTLNVNAQTTVSGGVGGGISSLTGDLGDQGSFGINYLLHGDYFLSDNFTVGLEYNGSAIALKSEESFVGISGYGADLVLATSHYYFGDGKVKPFVGIGLGAARVSTPEITIGTETIESDRKMNFGISPRAGVKFGNLGLAFSYNIAGKTPVADQINVAFSDKKFTFWTVGLTYDYPFEF